MTAEDDEWALDYLQDTDDVDSSFGIGSFRWKDAYSVVHRALWTKSHRGWATLCGARLPREEMRNDDHDPGFVTCIKCIAEDG